MTFMKAFMLAAAAAFTCMVISAGPSNATACEKRSFEEVRYIICSISPKNARLRLFWKNAEGQPYRTFSRVAKAVAAEGRSLTFAMNAGMYAEDFSPVGLYVENWQELRTASTAEMKGSPGSIPNFYKKPNGVFFLDQAGARILPTDVFLTRRGKVRIATQSGPMLVVQNELHPAFILGSKDRTRRSGVGICERGTVRFAISEEAVNFYDFAQFFRDGLKCPDALFLDGGRGVGLYNPGISRNDLSGHGGYGPIVGLVE
ncbi:phosphodiester glycosidase family protein [Sinorhizobium meliloti]|uniref:phosphodiester glycosidase family protein n=1 Tax=Rhizobium meliloti TaxID=382 RepID=UPI0018E0453F|nr:phosphodiester glycosidase family protein [Sinorhizobium meliloti]